MRPLALILVCLLVTACALAPTYDETWSLDSPVFDEEAVLGQASLLPSQQAALYTSIWTFGGDSLRRRQEYHLRTQHELWVRRQVELKKMTIEEAHARIQDYTPSKKF